jgi:hypothetical protein
MESDSNTLATDVDLNGCKNDGGVSFLAFSEFGRRRQTVSTGAGAHVAMNADSMVWTPSSLQN